MSIKLIRQLANCVPSNTAQNIISSWASLEHHNIWQSTAGCRQAKVLLQGPNKRLACFAMGSAQSGTVCHTGTSLE